MVIIDRDELIKAIEGYDFKIGHLGVRKAEKDRECDVCHGVIHEGDGYIYWPTEDWYNQKKKLRVHFRHFEDEIKQKITGRLLTDE